MLSKNKKELITGILKKIPGLACAYLHGSATTDYFRHQSDIDLALLFQPGIRTRLNSVIQICHVSIESVTGHPPHFSILSSKNVVFAKEVVTKGELLLCPDPYICKSFTMHTLSMYAVLNDERKQILEQYVA
jgi:predicted nucleotidyltransferase